MPNWHKYVTYVTTIHAVIGNLRGGASYSSATVAQTRKTDFLATFVGSTHLVHRACPGVPCLELEEEYISLN
jgi:hypothetical protein